MKRWLHVTVLALLALSLPAAVALAQGGEETEAYEGRFSFTYPSGWVLKEVTEDLVLLTQPGATITFYGHGYLQAALASLDFEDPPQLLAAFLGEEGLAPADPDPDPQAGALAAARLGPVDADRLGLALLFALHDGQWLVVTLLADADALQAVALDFAAIVSTIGPLASQAAEPCTISTDQVQAVRVRVGPGVNRTAITFLPANTPFAVLGQAQAADGSLWWKLDKEQVAPHTAAAELWVAQDDVTAQGDCDAVGQAATPPIRWASATRCRQSVVFPEDSGPKISVTLPRGIPPTPRAISKESEPVGMASTSRCWASPSRMMAPSP